MAGKKRPVACATRKRMRFEGGMDVIQARLRSEGTKLAGRVPDWNLRTRDPGRSVASHKPRPVETDSGGGGWQLTRTTRR